MFHIYFSEKVELRIHGYIDTYRTAYLKLYDDTGLGEAEIVIKNGYIQNADILEESLYDAIMKRLEYDAVLGYTLDPIERCHHTTTSLGSRRIYITYTEDTETQERVVKDIEIGRK